MGMHTYYCNVNKGDNMPTMVNLTCEICGSLFIKEFKKRHHKTCSRKCSYDLRQKNRKKIWHQTEKFCDTCNEIFIDTSKKQTVKTCKACVSKKMVISRFENGNGKYHSDEWMADNLKRFGLSVRNKANSDDHKKLLSETMKKNWENGKLYQGDEHWTKTKEGKQRISQWKKGVPLSDSAKANIRKAQQKRLREKPETYFSRGKGGYRDDLGHYVRSSWEANYARIILAEGKEYQYEPETFLFKDGSSYTPDFKVDDYYVEIKGYWDPVSIEKCQKFENEFPQFKLVKIGPDSYNDLIKNHLTTITTLE